jgi:hypothetical protein
MIRRLLKSLKQVGHLTTEEQNTENDPHLRLKSAPAEKKDRRGNRDHDVPLFLRKWAN